MGRVVSSQHCIVAPVCKGGAKMVHGRGVDGWGPLLVDAREHGGVWNWRSSFSIQEAVQIMLAVAEGMLFLHDKGIVHRDLKSGNILEAREGN